MCSLGDTSRLSFSTTLPWNLKHEYISAFYPLFPARESSDVMSDLRRIIHRDKFYPSSYSVCKRIQVQRFYLGSSPWTRQFLDRAWTCNAIIPLPSLRGLPSNIRPVRKMTMPAYKTCGLNHSHRHPFATLAAVSAHNPPRRETSALNARYLDWNSL